MSELVFKAIGKYVHATRYCQIVETESSHKLSSEEQDAVTRDQKHSSQVARTYYQKRSSHEIASTAKSAMIKLQNSEINKEVRKVIFDCDDHSDSEGVTSLEGETSSEQRNECDDTGTPTSSSQESIMSFQPPVRKASKMKSKPIVGQRVPFTPEEDLFLKRCHKIYGFGKWTAMLRDPRFHFNKKRTADSLKK